LQFPTSHPSHSLGCYQLCVVHFKRKVLNTVSTKDKAEVGEELKALFPVEHTDMTPLAAYENLRTFA